MNIHAEREKFDLYYGHLPKFERDRMWRLYEDERIQREQLLYEASLKIGNNPIFSTGGGGTQENPETPVIPVTPDNTIFMLFTDLSQTPVSDVYSVSEWQTFFDPGDVYSGRIISSEVNISDKSVTLGTTGVLEETTPDSFSGYTSLIRFIDSGYIQNIGSGYFAQCSNLVYVELPSVKEIQEYGFFECISLFTCILPAIQTIGNFGFDKCESLDQIVYPTLQTLGTAGFGRCLSSDRIILENLLDCEASSFAGCSSVAEIQLPSCTNLGGTVGDNSVFGFCINVSIGIFNSVIETCNSGSPDGDIGTLIANSPSVSISYV
jgi:hypothetical protein